jgi:hypothetical protein
MTPDELKREIALARRAVEYWDEQVAIARADVRRAMVAYRQALGAVEAQRNNHDEDESDVHG